GRHRPKPLRGTKSALTGIATGAISVLLPLGAWWYFWSEAQARAQALEVYEQGVALHNKGDFQEAISEYTRAMEIHPDGPQPFMYLHRGLARLNMKDFKGAIADCNAAIGLDYELAEAYLYRGLAQYALLDWVYFRNDCGKAVTLNPGVGPPG